MGSMTKFSARVTAAGEELTKAYDAYYAEINAALDELNATIIGDKTKDIVAEYTKPRVHLSRDLTGEAIGSS